MIPKIIHFVWIGKQMPDWAVENIDRFERLNPDHEIIIHSGPHDLHQSLVEAYESCTDPAQKSDIIRYSVLYNHGGWYFDTDFFPFRPVTDAEHGICLPKGQVFISRQAGHKAGDRLPYANAPLACEAGARGMRELITAAARTENTQRCSFGPTLVKHVVNRRRDLFTIGEAAWFFPLSVDDSRMAIPYLYGGREDSVSVRSEGTGGHMPIAAHLWASATTPCERHRKAPPFALVQKQVVERGLDRFTQGLESVGFHVEREASLNRRPPIIPDLIVCWNGRRDTTWRDYANKHNVPIFYAEYGFFDRGSHYQVDPQGILQWSRFSESIADPAAESERCRLKQFCAPKPVEARRNGDILIFGQLDNDTQLEGCPVAGHAPLLKIISKALPDGMRAVFRPHPMHTRALRHTFSNIDIAERGAYKTKQAPDMPEALAKARFCIALNSNALVEATAAGVPCMAFGPSLGLMAGVYKRATVRFLEQDIQDMLDGWVPDHGRAESYLSHLASNQYSADELADPTVVQSLIWHHYPDLAQKLGEHA